VKQALADGVLDAGRWANYAKLQRELAYLEAQHDEQAGRERKERERRIHRVARKEQKKQRRG
jgi:ribosome biogenesis GTPase